MSDCDCCTELAMWDQPGLRVAVYAANLEKCGFLELTSPSTPPKHYLQKKQEITWEGSHTTIETQTKTYENPPPPDQTRVIEDVRSISGYCLKLDEYTPATVSGGECDLDEGDWTAPDPLLLFLTDTFTREESCTGGGPGSVCPGNNSLLSESYDNCDPDGEDPDSLNTGTSNYPATLTFPSLGPGEGLVNTTTVNPNDKTYKKTVEWEGCLLGCTQTDPFDSWSIVIPSNQWYGTRVISGPGVSMIEEITLLDEYDTGQLIANTAIALALFSDSSAANAIAIRDLSADEESYALQRATLRVEHTATPTGYLKVWFKYTLDTAETGDWESPYIWQASVSTVDEKLLIQGPLLPVDEPEGNGSIAVSIEKWSMLPGYTPTTGQTNGLPDWPAGGVVP